MRSSGPKRSGKVTPSGATPLPFGPRNCGQRAPGLASWAETVAAQQAAARASRAEKRFMADLLDPDEGRQAGLGIVVQPSRLHGSVQARRLHHNPGTLTGPSPYLLAFRLTFSVMTLVPGLTVAVRVVVDGSEYIESIAPGASWVASPGMVLRPTSSTITL